MFPQATYLRSGKCVSFEWNLFYPVFTRLFNQHFILLSATTFQSPWFLTGSEMGQMDVMGAMFCRLWDRYYVTVTCLSLNARWV